MRDTEASNWMVPVSMGALMRAMRLAVVALGVGLVLTAGAARAEDDDEDDKTFEEKIIEGLMAGIGGTNMENRGIEYRERSPLVVPPKLDLRPPEEGKIETAPFKGEPTRDSLTQPPPGYQTPSPNFAYGTGPKESLNKPYNPAAGKYAE